MRYKFIFLLAGISNMIFAQMNYDKPTWSIKANATSLIDIFTFPTIQLSVEKQLSDYFSLSTEGGYQLYNFSHVKTPVLNTNGFKVNLELRYYLSKFLTTRLSNKLGRAYMGLRPFYSQNQGNASISYKAPADPAKWIDDDFGVKNTTYGVNYILGFQKTITENLFVDLHTGAGIMQRNVSNTELQYIKDAGYTVAGTGLIKFFKSLNLSETSGLRGNVLFGFRIGYKF